MKKSEARDILGVDSLEDISGIKAAFRNLCHQHHPDIGGDRAMFEQIQIAYKRLTNDEDLSPDVGRAYSELLSAFENVISSTKLPNTIDLMYRVNEVIERAINSIDNNITALSFEEEKINIVLRRLKCKTNHNPITLALTDKSESINDTIADLRYQKSILELSLVLSKNYSYNFDSTTANSNPFSNFKLSLS